MRTLLVLLGIVVLAVVGLMYFGIINIDQTRPAVVQVPSRSVLEFGDAGRGGMMVAR